ncbi:hypothetical protein B0H16DRAFT_1740955 [Mycena metata]|uniref:Uncharacterized protein n=1 Tax=Mycena metata TaxID=1033252 RepID=A0AAD7HCS8_9AGAR|nr:hypothetical protein B0H16DRAFT_1740955 [Mycena metata]
MVPTSSFLLSGYQPSSARPSLPSCRGTLTPPTFFRAATSLCLARSTLVPRPTTLVPHFFTLVPHSSTLVPHFQLSTRLPAVADNCTAVRVITTLPPSSSTPPPPTTTSSIPSPSAACSPLQHDPQSTSPPPAAGPSRTPPLGADVNTRSTTGILPKGCLSRPLLPLPLFHLAPMPNPWSPPSPPPQLRSTTCRRHQARGTTIPPARCRVRPSASYPALQLPPPAQPATRTDVNPPPLRPTGSPRSVRHPPRSARHPPTAPATHIRPGDCAAHASRTLSRQPCPLALHSGRC